MSMYTPLSPDLYPGYQLAVSSISGQHSNYFHNSRILSNAVPLGFFVVAFPPPPITFRQRGSTCVELLCTLWRVLAFGFHSFLSEWLEKVSQPPLAEPFGSNLGRQWNQQPPVFSLARVSPPRLPIPLSVSSAVTLATGCLYAPIEIRSNFCVFYFQEKKNIFREVVD